MVLRVLFMTVFRYSALTPTCASMFMNTFQQIVVRTVLGCWCQMNFSQCLDNTLNVVSPNARSLVLKCELVVLLIKAFGCPISPACGTFLQNFTIL